MATSFINEHTAEYYLTSDLKSKLGNHFKTVVPVYPWLTRETSNISKAVHLDDRFKLLAVFPRRPKLKNDKSDDIYITINPELLEFQEYAISHNLPVIAGCPLAKNFWDLSNEIDVLWLTLKGDLLSNYLNPISAILAEGDLVLGKLEIIKMIENSNVFDMKSFENFIREARSSLPASSFFGPRYKPIYFIFKEQ
ncbi:MAG: hypothetical protein CL666_10530 [Balneola sp.]|nr:hypothetical protein [Balneola sp.]|tara:strand:- start:43542 stop:44126 length:585 start_codon:yes stop_codon:yes gene_type:complete